MSLGKQFLRACIQADQVVHLARTADEFFVEEELPTVQWIRNHNRQHGKLPSLKTLSSAGYSLKGPTLDASEPPEFYQHKLKERFLFNVFNGAFPIATAAMQERDMEAVTLAFKDALSKAGLAGLHHQSTLLSDEVDKVVAEYKIAKMNPGLRGVTLGYETLDEATLGAMPGDLIVIAGRPGMGKTFVMLKMAHGAWQAGHRCLFTSMEMPKTQITERMIGIESGINPRLIRAGTLSDEVGEPRFMEAVQRIKDAAGKIHLEAGDFEGKVSGVEEMIQQYQPEICYIDAAYLMSPEGARQGYISKWESISMLMAQLKIIAKRYLIPIVITVQFNKARQKDKGSVEMDTSDLGGSDSIAQDASEILGIQRPMAPFTEVRRFIQSLKSREGGECSMTINYTFDPVDLGEIPPDQLIVGADEEVVHDENWTL